MWEVRSTAECQADCVCRFAKNSLVCSPLCRHWEVIRALTINDFPVCHLVDALSIDVSRLSTTDSLGR